MNSESEKTILIVEDSTLLWSAMKRALRLSHPEVVVVCVGSLEEALEFLSKRTADLIICDYFLPNLRNGMELWDHPSIKGLRMPFIMISGMGTVEFLNLVSQFKVCPTFLAKPFSIESMIGMVNEKLGLRTSLRKAA